jgi:hypothetical protein
MLLVILVLMAGCSSQGRKESSIRLLEDESDNFMFLGDTERLRGRLKEAEAYYARSAGAYLLKLSHEKFILAVSKAAMTSLLSGDTKRGLNWLEKGRDASKVWDIDSVDLKIATATYHFALNQLDEGKKILREVLTSDSIALEKRIYVKFLLVDKEESLPIPELESDYQGLVTRLEDGQLENPEILIHGGLVLAEKYLSFDDLEKSQFYLEANEDHLRRFEAVASVKKHFGLKEKWFLKKQKVDELEALQRLRVDYNEAIKNL